MKLRIKQLSGRISIRDAGWNEVRRAIDEGLLEVKELDLREVIRRLRLEVRAPGKSEYRGHQGATITPKSLWAAVVVALQRRGPPKGTDLMFREPNVAAENGRDVVYLTLCPSAIRVKGTGTQKEKWRNISPPWEDRGVKMCADRLFLVATSAWLAPFAVYHRYLAVLPARFSIRSARDTKIEPVSLRHYGNADSVQTTIETEEKQDLCEKYHSSWLQWAQKEWASRKSKSSPADVSEWVNYQNKLSKQNPGTLKVVWMSRRKLYSAVLIPESTTPLGFPMNRLLLKTIRLENGDAQVLREVRLPSRGLPLVLDNMLHYIETKYRDEAYWICGVFNSRPFREAIKKFFTRKGSPPDIYNLPPKLLAKHIPGGYNPASESHLSVVSLSKRLERICSEAVKKYLEIKLGSLVKTLDDTQDPWNVPKIREDLVFSILEGTVRQGKKSLAAQVCRALGDTFLREARETYSRLNAAVCEML